MSNITTDFVTATKKIHADVRAILTALHLIHEDVKVIRDQTVSTSDHQSPDDQTSKPDEKQTARVSSRSKLLNMNESDGEEEEAGNNQEPYLRDLVERFKKSARNPRFIVEVLALVGLFAYACETRRTNNLTSTSIDNNTRQFQIDQRPYLWDNNVKPPMSIALNEKMWANIPLINYGKSPALKTYNSGMIFVGPTAMRQADQWFAQFGNAPSYIPPDATITVVPPGIPFPVQPLDPSKLPSVPIGSARVDPETFGGGGVIGVQTANILKQPDIDYLRTTDQSAVIVAHLEYFDSFGNFYWSNICLSTFVNGNIPHCTRHNEIH